MNLLDRTVFLSQRSVGSSFALFLSSFDFDRRSSFKDWVSTLNQRAVVLADFFVLVCLQFCHAI